MAWPGAAGPAEGGAAGGAPPAGQQQPRLNGRHAHQDGAAQAQSQPQHAGQNGHGQTPAAAPQPQAPPLAVTRLLLAAQEPDAGARSGAEAALEALQRGSYGDFLESLAWELADAAKPPGSRRLAGILLKNALSEEDAPRWAAAGAPLRARVRASLLRALSPGARGARAAAAVAAARLAAAELRGWAPAERGLTLGLLAGAHAAARDAGARRAALRALRYACEELHAAAPPLPAPRRAGASRGGRGSMAGATGAGAGAGLGAAEAGAVVRAALASLGPGEVVAETRLAAAEALQSVLPFAAQQFESEPERDAIMLAACKSTLDADPRVREQCFACLCDVSVRYYRHMQPYMQEVFALSLGAIQGPSESAALRAVELWSALADHELAMQEQGEPHSGFVAAAAPYLVEGLLAQLVKQEEGQEQDEGAWNLAIGAGTCLGLVARAVGDNVVYLVMPFVSANVARASAPGDWRRREAATFALGSILEGPSPDVLIPLVQRQMPRLLQGMSDPHPHVRDTAAWAITRALEHLHCAGGHGATPRTLLSREFLPPLVKALRGGLRDAPHIARRACDAIGLLAAGFADAQRAPGALPRLAPEELAACNAQAAQRLLRLQSQQAAAPPPEPAEPGSQLAPHFRELAGDLLAAAGRGSGALHSHAYEALDGLVMCAPPAAMGAVEELLPAVLSALSKALAAPARGGGRRDRQSDVLGSLCGALQALFSRLSRDARGAAVLDQHSDEAMALLTRVVARLQEGPSGSHGGSSCGTSGRGSCCSCSGGGARAEGGSGGRRCGSACGCGCGSGGWDACAAGAAEEALQAVGVLALGMGPAFRRHLPVLYPHLSACLSDHREWQACLAAVGVLTDLCSSVGADLAPRAGDILGVLIANLGDDNLHPSLRPQILSTLGDLALALGPLLEPHMPLLLPALRAATAAAAAAAPSSAATGAGGAAAPPGRASPDVGAQDPAAELRIGVLEAYGGLFQGLPPGAAQAQLAAEVPAVIEFCNALGREPGFDELVVRAAVRLLGDMAASVQGAGASLARARGRGWERLVLEARRSAPLAEELDWALIAIRGSTGGAA